MSKARGNPADQPFNVSPRRCQSKTKAWFQKSPWHNNAVKKAPR